MKGILGKKLGMTRVIKDDGVVVPVTIIECSPNTITQVKTEDNDGYNAIVLGYSKRRQPSKTKKYYYSKEIKVEDTAGLEKGTEVTIGIFEEGDKVSLTGVSKGKGFQGGIKRWNFSRGPESHGSHHHREPGSVGACASPGRIHKGKKMPGHLGNAKTTIKRTEIAYIDPKKNLIGIRGPVPGSINSYVTINKLT